MKHNLVVSLLSLALLTPLAAATNAAADDNTRSFGGTLLVEQVVSSFFGPKWWEWRTYRVHAMELGPRMTRIYVKIGPLSAKGMEGQEDVLRLSKETFRKGAYITDAPEGSSWHWLLGAKPVEGGYILQDRKAQNVDSLLAVGANVEGGGIQNEEDHRNFAHFLAENGDPETLGIVEFAGQLKLTEFTAWQVGAS